ncbi:16741_t:CDS:1, partial [Funneliformis geosporum]
LSVLHDSNNFVRDTHPVHSGSYLSYNNPSTMLRSNALPIATEDVLFEVLESFS